MKHAARPTRRAAPLETRVNWFQKLFRGPPGERGPQGEPAPDLTPLTNRTTNLEHNVERLWEAINTKPPTPDPPPPNPPIKNAIHVSLTGNDSTGEQGAMKGVHYSSRRLVTRKPFLFLGIHE